MTEAYIDPNISNKIDSGVNSMCFQADICIIMILQHICNLHVLHVKNCQKKTDRHK